MRIVLSCILITLFSFVSAGDDSPKIRITDSSDKERQMALDYLVRAQMESERENALHLVKYTKVREVCPTWRQFSDDATITDAIRSFIRKQTGVYEITDWWARRIKRKICVVGFAILRDGKVTYNWLFEANTAVDIVRYINDDPQLLEYYRNILFYEASKAAQIIDGDTFVSWDSTRIQLIGVDAPEKSEPLAERAKAYLTATILGKIIGLKYDHSYIDVFTQEKDKYGHTLAYVSIGDVCINEELLKKGLARATPEYSFKEKDKYLALEAKAKQQKIGIWKE